LTGAVVKSIKPPVQTNEIFYGGTANLILSSTSSVVLHDIQQQKTIAELNTPPVKYIIWSQDASQVALLSKHSKCLAVSHPRTELDLYTRPSAITIANKTFSQSTLIHETIRIKSGAWDDAGVFVYSTLNHVKYCLPQGSAFRLFSEIGCSLHQLQ
jgi:coatomer subunit alpha